VTEGEAVTVTPGRSVTESRPPTSEVTAVSDVTDSEPRESANKGDQVLQSAVALVRQELNAEVVKYGTGGDAKW
jgi:hypothetical protein